VLVVKDDVYRLITRSNSEIFAGKKVKVTGTILMQKPIPASLENGRGE